VTKALPERPQNFFLALFRASRGIVKNDAKRVTAA
jgi:hypothetical protein